MLCAHTVRKLRPGTFEQFAAAFRPGDGTSPPPGWVRFTMLRGLHDEDIVVTFGFFDGTLDQLESSQDGHGYDDRVQAVAPYVESVMLNGVYEVVVDLASEGAGT
jgi:hypothetical protein